MDPFDTRDWRIESCGRVRWQRGCTLDPGWRSSDDDHADCSFFWYVWAGRGEVDTDRGTSPLRAGTCVWRAAEKPFRPRQDPSDPLGLIWINVKAVSPPLPAIWTPEAPAFAEAAAMRFVELTWLASGPAQRARGEITTASAIYPPPTHPRMVAALAILRALLLEGSVLGRRQARGGPPDRQQQLAASVALRLRQDPESREPLSELAKTFHCHPDHLNRVFRRVHGCSLSTFRQRFRAERAALLLRTTDLPIKAVAASVGYPDPLVFSRQFRRWAGCSPQECRNHQAVPGGI